MKQNKNIYTHIIGGKFKGKKLLLPSTKTTRSTKGILKASYFNTVQFDIVDSIFIEVFAGSGSMGLEALSRGAGEAYFIEKDKSAFNILKKNCESFEGIVCINSDAFLELPKIVERLSRAAFLYFDPPFDIRENMENIYDKSINLISSLPKSKVKLIALEHISSFVLPEFIGGFNLLKSKTFGNSALSFYA